MARNFVTQDKKDEIGRLRSLGCGYNTIGKIVGLPKYRILRILEPKSDPKLSPEAKLAALEIEIALAEGTLRMLDGLIKDRIVQLSRALGPPDSGPD